MATRRRQVPLAVREALERRERLQATMGERVRAAVPSARKQVAPIRVADTPRATPSKVKKDEVMKDDDANPLIEWMKHLGSITLPSSMWGNGLGNLILSPSWIWSEASPVISPDTLKALKSATPFKVEPAPPQVPDMVECITGWRGWAVGTDRRLKALGKITSWPERKALEAGCESGAWHEAPDWDCTCGIWAFKDVDRLVAAIGSTYTRAAVIGSVSLWGKVIETENGYRAARAYPKELWLLNPSLEFLGALYDVPIRRLAS